MKKIILLVSAAVVSIAASAQSITIVQKGQEVLSVSPSTVDEIVFSMDEPTGTVASGGSQAVNGKWCSIGTSIIMCRQPAAVLHAVIRIVSWIGSHSRNLQM